MKRAIPFVIGKIYHVYNRGVAKCSISDGSADSWRFLQGLCLFNDITSVANILWQLERERGRLTLNVLKEYLKKEGEERSALVRILAYCLMGNHYHLLLEEIREGGISKFMHKLGGGYARYFNTKHDRVGSLFQDKFKSVLVDNEEYLQYVLVYINVLNPAEFIEHHWKENGIGDIEQVLKFAEEYLGSSHLDYLGKRGSLILDKGILGEIFSTPDKYMEFVRMVLRDKKYENIVHLTLE